ncbi:MAG: Holliday junction resolvase RuvX [Vicinamibacterales bacterium]
MGTRVLGIDVGRRRVGLAISDPTGTLARPLRTLTVSDHDRLDRVAEAITALAQEDDGLATVVVGLPVRLDGTDNEQTKQVAMFIAGLRARVEVPLVEAEERLSSREAESRLALREPDWRKRKEKLDAAAAAVILQDFLDRPER